MNRLSSIESNIIKVHDKIRKEQRARELLNWARDDYGIDMTSQIQEDYKKKTSKSKIEINDEVEFIFKVRSQHINRVNNEGAKKIQSIFRGFMCRVRYLRMRNFVLYHVVKIQAFYRMKLQRRIYLRGLAIHYFRASVKI